MEEFEEIKEESLSFMESGYVNGLKTLADTFKMKFVRHLVYGILAGIWIGVAYTVAVYGAYQIKNPSIIKLIMGVIFPLVILLIFFLGGQFFTAYTYALSGVIRGLTPWKEALKAFGAVYLGNIIGCFVFAILIELAQVLNTDQKYADFIFNSLSMPKFFQAKSDLLNGMANNKELFSSISAKNLGLSIMGTFFSAILCNMVVSNTVPGGKSTKGNIVASIIMFWTVIFMFVTAGYQHSVANWYIAAMLLVMGWFHNNVNLTLANGTIVSWTASLEIGWVFVVLSIIPSIVGNVVGALVIGELLYFVNKKNAKILFKNAKLTRSLQKNNR